MQTCDHCGEKYKLLVHTRFDYGVQLGYGVNVDPKEELWCVECIEEYRKYEQDYDEDNP